MNEGEIRMLSQVFSLYAELSAKIARIEGMKAENTFRSICGESPAYTESAFVVVQQEIEAIGSELKRM
jgi:hypothetical protein